MRQSFLDTIFNESEIAEDESGYDKQELEEAFVKHFIKGYPEEEADNSIPKIHVAAVLKQVLWRTKLILN